MPNFQKAYGRNAPVKHPVMRDPDDVSRTKQEFKNDADINFIVARATKTGMPPMTNFSRPGFAPRKPIYGDFTAIDYHQMNNTVADIEMKFQGLPARIRSRFRNKAENLMRWVEDPKNYEEAVKLGLLVETPEAAQERHEKAMAAQNDHQEEEPPKTAPKPDDEAQPGYERKPSNSAQKKR